MDKRHIPSLGEIVPDFERSDWGSRATIGPFQNTILPGGAVNAPVSRMPATDVRKEPGASVNLERAQACGELKDRFFELYRMEFERLNGRPSYRLTALARLAERFGERESRFLKEAA